MKAMRHLLSGIAAVAALSAAAPAAAQAPMEPSALPNTSCARECLLAVLKQHMDALGARSPSAVPVAPTLLYTENNVPIKLGEGAWAAVTAVDKVGLEVADPETGHAAWFGSIREHGVPAFYAVRIRVRDGRIDEIESVIHRKTGLPAPYGDAENMVHDPAFYEILPEEQRRPRERLRAIADSYFDTTELNDGQVFAPFDDECGRLENGISTTAAPKDSSGGGNAASIAQGCEDQFKLGIYKINKRIRERLYPIIDTERGIVVASGFFDHANEWDRYKLTDGREMRTALKWPNSITLLEAFRIKDAKIHRVEAVFTYVPYFMHNPFAGPDSKLPDHVAQPALCDSACVEANTRSVMSAYVRNGWQKVNWADTVGYAENSVGIRVSEGIWATVTAIDVNPLVISDAQTGKGVWIGAIEEHGQKAWAAITVTSSAKDGKPAVGAIDVLVRRKEYGAPFADPASPPQYEVINPANSTDRATMLAAADRFYASRNIGQTNGGGALKNSCIWTINGLRSGDCTATMKDSALSRVAQVRDRTLIAVDEERSLAVYRAFQDIPAHDTGYPLTFQTVEVLRFDRGTIASVDTYTSELPYGMKPHGSY